MFRTQYDRIEVISEHGDRFEETYTPVLSDTGVLELEADGMRDIYAYIQSFADSCDLNLIVARYAQGDLSAAQKLNYRQGMYGDFTEMPKTFAEMQQRIIDAENLFMSLPLETRAQYNHSAAEFVADIGSEKWKKAMGIEIDSSVKASEPVKDTQKVDPAGSKEVVKGVEE